jgi:hypothetical protein
MDGQAVWILEALGAGLVALGIVGLLLAISGVNGRGEDD